MNILQRKLVSADESEDTLKQHIKPCADCPFARTALKGWLGNLSIDDWIQAAHGESLIDCHVTKRWECAGAAIYRSNVCKLPPRGQLDLEPDGKLVFSTPMEFREYHERKSK